MINHWNGKTWYAYGTSMTSIQCGRYATVVRDLGGFTLVNKGIPGGSLTPDGFGKGNVKRAVMTLEDGKAEADLITLEVLPNESASIGDIYDTGDDTFCGCFNQCIRYLQENTDAQIVVIIMICGNDITPDQSYDNKPISEFEFAEKIERVARLNSVPVINVFCESGLGYGRVKGRKYQLDNIHLNDLGGKIVGKFVWSKLKDIPTWEK